MPENLRQLLPRLHRLLARLRRRQKLSWLLAGLLGLAAVAGALFLLALAFEALAWSDPVLRRPLATLLLVLALLKGLLLAGLLLFTLLAPWPDDQELARRISRGDPEVRDRLLNALQLARSPRSEDRESPALRELALRGADEEAEGLDPARYVEHRQLRKALRALAGTAGAALLLLALAGSSLLGAARRIAHPTVEYRRPGTVRLQLALPDTLRAVQGDTLRLAARVAAGSVDELTFVLEEPTGLRSTLPAAADSADPALYRARKQDVQRSLRLFARAGGTTSDTALVKVVPRPRIARLQVALHPPAYTGLEPLELPRGVGDVNGLPGSEVRVKLEASRELAGARLLRRFPEGVDTLAMAVEARRARARFSLLNPGSWWVELTARDSIASASAVHWSLRIVEDLAPRVEVLAPEDGALLPPELVVPLAALAEDDFGIERMRLRFRVHSPMVGPDSVGEAAYNAIELTPTVPDPGRALVRSRWGLADLPLLPSDEVHFFVEAWDNDPIHGPKRARSELRRLVFPSMEQLYERQDHTEETARGDLERAMEQAERTRRKLEENLRRLRSNPEEMTWEEAQSLQQSLQQQEETLRQLEEISSAVEEMAARAQEHELLSEELVEKYGRMQELMEEIATPELRQAMEQLQKAVEEMDGRKVREALEELSLDQEELLENLDRSLSILEQLRAERKMEELATRAEELAARQRDLAERAEQAQGDELERLAVEQERARRDLQSLADQAGEAAEELQSTHPEDADALQEQAEQLTEQGETSRAMEAARQGMEQQQADRARERAEEAASRMEQIATSMRQQQQQMAARGKQEIAADMERLYTEILLVSRRQEELRRTSRALSVASPRYRALAARQDALLRAMDVLDQRVEALMQRTFFVAAPLAAEMQRARTRMNTAILRYTDRNPREVEGDQTAVLAALHRALRTLDQSRQQMMGSGSGTGYAEMMQQLQQMAQAQQQLNQSSQGTPTPMPGGTGGSDLLQRLAARQRALAEQMGQLQGEASSMEELLGSLEGVGDAMEEVAKDLEEQNVTERTRRLQHRIVQRLLDSQRSLQQRERSRRRTGRVAEGIEPPSDPGEALPRGENPLRARMLRALEGDYARPWKPVIRDYFRALEKERQRSPAAGSDTTLTP